MLTLLVFTSFISGIFSIQCYVDQRDTVGREHTDQMTNTTCDSGCNFCVKWQGRDRDLMGTYWGCGCGKNKQYADLADCKAIGKRSEQLGEGTNLNTKVYVWCCKEDYCNTSNFKFSFLFFILSIYLACPFK